MLDDVRFSVTKFIQRLVGESLIQGVRASASRTPPLTARRIDLFTDMLALMRRIRIKRRTHERPWLLTIVLVILLGLGNAFDAVPIWVLELG